MTVLEAELLHPFSSVPIHGEGLVSCDDREDVRILHGSVPDVVFLTDDFKRNPRRKGRIFQVLQETGTRVTTSPTVDTIGDSDHGSKSDRPFPISAVYHLLKELLEAEKPVSGSRTFIFLASSRYLFSISPIIKRLLGVFGSSIH